jgi:hypothetical protein
VKTLGPSCRDCPDLGFVDIGDELFVCAACFEARRASCAKSNSQIAEDTRPAVTAAGESFLPRSGSPAADLSFDDEVAALEACDFDLSKSIPVRSSSRAPALAASASSASDAALSFHAAGIDMNAATLRTTAASESVSKSTSLFKL